MLVGSFVFLLLLPLALEGCIPVAGKVKVANETDMEALLAIKDEIAKDPFGVLASWNQSLHFCNWRGVTCGAKHQRVVALNLSFWNLGGSLSPHIGNLSFLKVIDLEGNSFHGLIPQEMGRLRRLQNLLLANNSFQGELPANLSYCLALENLSVAGNQLEGRIPMELGSMSRLRGIGMGKNNLIGGIPSSFGNLSDLVFLSLPYNNLQGNIPWQLGLLSKLDYLQLSINYLSGLVPRALYNLSSVSFFATAGNKLSGEMPHDIGLMLHKFQTLFMGGNQFTGSIPASLANCSTLVQIDMSYNDLTGPVPKNLGALQNLELLNFELNQLGDDNATDELSLIITSLTNCTQLNALSFARNHLRGKIPESIANFSANFQDLWLSDNQIYGNIPVGIANLAGLEILSLSFNMLTGTIPDSIGKLSNLLLIEIRNNNLSGKIPVTIGNIYKLTELAISGNLLEGSIPDSLGNCSYLEKLNLSNNQLSGTIPEQVFGLSSLSRGLILASNQLTGPLPPNLSSLRNLNLFDISENKLFGEIPDAIGDCELLESLNMSSNSFEGPIPSSIGKLRGIQVLDLSWNNLSGQIPNFLGELSLQWINLSFNNLEGSVPLVGVFKNFSAFSVLGNGGLCGGITELKLPKCPTKASGKGKHHPREPLIIALSVCTFITVLLACFLILKYHTSYSKKELRVVSEMEKKRIELSYADLYQATQGFSSANLVGQGKYGSVFKGFLVQEEREIAVKVLHLEEEGASRSFIAECKVLRNTRHRNLVKILTACSSIDFQGNDFKALVFEFMPNGSLEKWLNPTTAADLEWQSQSKLSVVQRLNIATDVASALCYLHHEFDMPVVHCDLKPSNVLLDEDFTAHVSDFGLTKFVPKFHEHVICDGMNESSSIGVRGTVGYIAPEYGMGAEISIAGDVYSYGVLLLELFTGRSPTGDHTMNRSLHEFVRLHLPNQVMEIVDGSILEELDHNSEAKNQEVADLLVSVLRIGVLCSSVSPTERMSMRDVLKELQRTTSKLARD